MKNLVTHRKHLIGRLQTSLGYKEAGLTGAEGQSDQSPGSPSVSLKKFCEVNVKIQ
jgi:hypothetical protein